MASTDPLPGTVIAGKYRVERTLGQGGMGVVVEATHLRLGHRVAVKLLGKGSPSPEDVERFLREAQIAARLPGPNIARVTDSGQTDDGDPFLVMELLVGADLEAELRARGPLPVEEAIDCVLGASRGVAEAHAVGLVHRDLKPANLFLVRERGGNTVVKVLDFGISKVMQEGSPSVTATNAVLGTPQYMTPEQIHSAKLVDARTDQHALAAILFELLARRPAYVAETVPGLSVAIATKPPPRIRTLRPDVPKEVDAAIVRALAKRRSDRYPDLAAFAAALAPFGSERSREAARAIRETLAGAVPETSASIAARATTGDKDAGDSVEWAPTLSAHTQSTSTLARPRARRWIVVGAALALAAGGASATALLRRRPVPSSAHDETPLPASASSSSALVAVPSATSQDAASPPSATFSAPPQPTPIASAVVPRARPSRTPSSGGAAKPAPTAEASDARTPRDFGPRK